MNTHIIKNPRITEKGSTLLEKNIYTFDVMDGANKTEIKKAVFALYKVKPLRVHVVNTPKKKVVGRLNIGTRGGGKKALVYLKEGDKIEFI